MKHTDVLDIVNATRPAQTSERITNALNAKRSRSGLTRVSQTTVRSYLITLHSQGLVIRLTGDAAAACGAFPDHYGPRAAFWISAENYRTYHPGAELPPVEQAPASRPDVKPDEPDTDPVPGLPRETAAPSIDAATLAALDTLRRHVQADITTLATLPDHDDTEEALSAKLITLLRALGAARWAFIGGDDTEQEPDVKPPNGTVLMPTFQAAD